VEVWKRLCKRKALIAMNNLIKVFIPVLLIFSCQDPKPPCQNRYYDGTMAACANGKYVNGKEQGTFIFLDTTGKGSFLATGEYKDGFRTGLWSYDDKGTLRQATWTYYKDEHHGFETNLFSEADSLINTAYSSLFKISVDKPRDLQLLVTINGTTKDSILKYSYQSYNEKELKEAGFQMKNFVLDSISDGTNKIYLYSFSLHTSEKTDIVHGAYSTFGEKNTFVEIAVAYSENISFHANKLLSSVITNFYYQGERLFNPVARHK
jgi:hypothetical protein